MFEIEVTTKDGNVKRVMADTLEELKTAGLLHQNDALPVSPDINNPEHGNVVVSEFEAREPEPKATKAKSRKSKKENDMEKQNDDARLEDEQDNDSAEERTEGEVEQTEANREETEKAEEKVENESDESDPKK
jgi:hypothetical protein